MDKTNVMLLGASTALVLVLLSACGGGSDVAVAATANEQVPDEASGSTAGMAAWMTRLAASSTETLEPLEATRFNPPTPDDTEPEAVD